MPPREISIIGAGPSGLGAAWALHKAGFDDYTVYEQRSEAGGLASSDLFDGHWFDFGGHVLFVRNEPFRQMLDELFAPGELRPHRQRRILDIDGAVVRYPIEQHIDDIPEPWRTRIRNEHKPSVVRRDHFLVYLLDAFGVALSEIMFLPFNRRMWRVPLDTMSCEWLGSMVPKRGAFSCPRLYPAAGGIGEVWRRMSAVLHEKIQFGVLVHDPRALAKKGPVISSMPITALEPSLHQVLKSVPLWVERRVGAWPHGDCERLFRVGPAHYEALGSPADRNAYTVEWNETPKASTERCRFEPLSYPVPTLTRDRVIAPVLAKWRDAGVWSTGRFGDWRYEDAHMDKCFLRGWTIAQGLLHA